MAKILGYNEIGYVAATFKVDATTISKLKSDYLNDSTQRVDVNGKNLGVALKGDHTVGFGASAPTAADSLFGILIAYEQDGYATVMTKGYMEEVPTSGAVTLGSSELAVNDSGLITEVKATSGPSATAGAKSKGVAIKAATLNDKTITVEF